MSEPVKEEAAVELDPAAGEPAHTKFAGGEIHIVADGNTGAMNIQAPPDLIVALGILEVAKVMIISNMQQKVAASRIAPRPAIIPANGAQLKDLDARMRKEGLLKGA